MCDIPTSGKYGGWSTTRCECARFDWCFPCMGSVWHGSTVPFYSFCQLHCHCEYGRGIDAVGSKNELLVNVETEQRGVSGSSLQRQSSEEANSAVSSLHESQSEPSDNEEEHVQQELLAPSEIIHWQGEAQSIDRELSTPQKTVYKAVPFPGITIYQVPKRTQKFESTATHSQVRQEPEAPYLRADLYAYEVPLKFSR